VTISVAAVLVLAAVFGPLIAPDIDRSSITEALQAPSFAHLFGTDQQGRDIFWRVVVGARYTLTSAVIIVVGYALLGVLIATLATTGPRWTNEMLTRFIDLGIAFPSLVFALGVAAALGPSLPTACIAMVVTGWPMTARLLQGIMKETLALPFVEAATVLGASPLRLMAHHLLPNSLPPLWIKWTGDIGNTALVLGALSFIGAGAQPPLPEWGAMVAASQEVAMTAWWTILFPGLAIVVTTTTFGLLGDMLHARMDPSRSRTRRRHGE